MIEGTGHIKTFQEMTKAELISIIYNLKSECETGKKAIEELKRIKETESILVCNVCGNESGGYKGDSCPCGEGVLHLKKVKETNHV